MQLTMAMRTHRYDIQPMFSFIAPVMIVLCLLLAYLALMRCHMRKLAFGYGIPDKPLCFNFQRVTIAVFGADLPSSLLMILLPSLCRAWHTYRAFS